MKEVERLLRAVLADVREQGVALEAAVEKIYSGPALREALFVDVSEMVIRSQEQQEFLSIRREAGLKIDPGTAEAMGRYVQILDPYGIHDLSPGNASVQCCSLAPPAASGFRSTNFQARLWMP